MRRVGREVCVPGLAAALCDAIPEPILMTDGNARILHANEPARLLFGSGVVRGSRIEHATCAALSDLAEDILSGTRSSGATVTTTHAGRIVEIRGTREDGVLIFVASDCSGERRIERMQSEFIANVSHELRTPLTSIKGFVETLLDGAMHDPAARRQFLSIVLRQTERLRALVTDLLNLAQLQHAVSDAGVRMSNVRAGVILSTIRGVVEADAERKSISLDFVCDDDLWITVNRALVEHALKNLVENAIKFSEAGKRIVVAVKSSEETISFSVRDEGIGIPEEQVPVLFERFASKRRADSPGTGLGLALVRQIATAHGGSISVQSTVGLGSEFTLSLPAQTGRTWLSRSARSGKRTPLGRLPAASAALS